MTTTRPVRNFELRVLRPLWVAVLGAAAVLGLNGQWVWLGASILGLLILGAIGSQLHPIQSASELAEGPLEGSAAKHESVLLPDDVQRLLVDRACLRVGMFLGALAFLVGFWALGVRWWLAGIVAWLLLLLSAALLKVAFKTV